MQQELLALLIRLYEQLTSNWRVGLTKTGKKREERGAFASQLCHLFTSIDSCLGNGFNIQLLTFNDYVFFSRDDNCAKPG